MAYDIPELSSKLSAAAAALKAIGHPTRLDIIISLEAYEMDVTTLTRLTGTKQYDLSKHLAVLSEAGFVTVRKAGRTHYYRLTDPSYADKVTNLIADRL